jgi:polar amino acid transport system permease protein
LTGSDLVTSHAGVLAYFDTSVFLKYLFSDIFFAPAILVVEITLVAQTLGVVLGFPLALGRISKRPLLHLPVDAYLYIFRGTPLLLQILFVSTGIAELFQDPTTDQFPDILKILTQNAVVAGTIALTLNEAAYMTEIIRSGLEAIDPGQYDAARALGMSPWQVQRRVVIPQTLRIALPPTVNEYINMSKNTSLLTVVGVVEILATAERVYGSNYKVFELLSVASIWYLLITTLLTQIQKQVENRFGERQAVAVRPAFARRMFTGMFLGPRGRDAGGH